MIRPDIPFAKDDANRFLPWMIGLNSALAALMLFLGITLGQWAALNARGLTNEMTVQVPQQGERHSMVLTQVRQILAATPVIEESRELAEVEVQKMLEPWLGESIEADALPLPTVIKLRLRGGQEDKAESIGNALKEKLQVVAPDITLDARAVWAQKFSRFSTLVQGAVFFIALSVLAALAGMMVFSARATMKLHERTVGLLHSIGAPDAYIARQFQQNALLLTLRGALAGTLAAGALYLIILAYAISLDLPLAARLNFTAWHVAVLLVLPCIAAVVAMASTRASVMAKLEEWP